MMYILMTITCDALYNCRRLGYPSTKPCMRCRCEVKNRNARSSSQIKRMQHCTGNKLMWKKCAFCNPLPIPLHSWNRVGFFGSGSGSGRVRTNNFHIFRAEFGFIFCSSRNVLRISLEEIGKSGQNRVFISLVGFGSRFGQQGSGSGRVGLKNYGLIPTLGLVLHPKCYACFCPTLVLELDRKFQKVDTHNAMKAEVDAHLRKTMPLERAALRRFFCVD